MTISSVTSQIISRIVTFLCFNMCPFRESCARWPAKLARTGNPVFTSLFYRDRLDLEHDAKGKEADAANRDEKENASHGAGRIPQTTEEGD